jgi:putative membrane protein
MNTTSEPKPTLDQDHSRFSKFIIRSAAAAQVMILLAVAFLTAVPRANASMTVSTADQDFMLAAGQINLTEIRLGEYAAQNGPREDVKEFGRRMVKDHTALNANLKALAAQKGVTLSDSLDATHQKMVDKLTALTGSDFDKTYIADMFTGHTKAVKAFKTESAKTNDAEVKNFADNSIPVLEEHLKLITAIKNAAVGLRVSSASGARN